MRSKQMRACATLAAPMVTMAPGVLSRGWTPIFAASVVFAFPRGKMAHTSRTGPKYARAMRFSCG